MKLSLAQKIIKLFSSGSAFEKMMADSMRYRFTCSCGKETSIWDIGGIRYKAFGNPKTSARCTHCGKIAMRTIYKVEN
ncbi:MAG: hypothetical protein IPH68_07005 [Chitinophagaceae bacterium]|nr:hypothetical protein [Chitinophagaceae bacterium]